MAEGVASEVNDFITYLLSDISRHPCVPVVWEYLIESFFIALSLVLLEMPRGGNVDETLIDAGY